MVALGLGVHNSFDGGYGWTVVPVAGPWGAIGARDFKCKVNSSNFDVNDPSSIDTGVTAAEAERCIKRAQTEAIDIAILAVDGMVQATGAALLLAGLASGVDELVWDGLKDVHVSVGPRPEGGGPLRVRALLATRDSPVLPGADHDRRGQPTQENPARPGAAWPQSRGTRQVSSTETQKQEHARGFRHRNPNTKTTREVSSTETQNKNGIFFPTPLRNPPRARPTKGHQPEVNPMSTRIQSGPSPNVAVTPTAARTTAPPVRPFQQVMKASADAIVNGAETAVARLPGGAVLAAAMRPGPELGGSASSPIGPSSSFEANGASAAGLSTTGGQSPASSACSIRTPIRTCTSWASRSGSARKIALSRPCPTSSRRGTRPSRTRSGISADGLEYEHP